HNMNIDINLILVLCVIVFAAGLFISNKFRVDIIALSVLAILLLSGLISHDQALFGFTNPATATIAALFVLSAGLVRTGIVRWLSFQVDKLSGKREWRLILVLCVFVAVLSAFINNTAIVAIFIPIAIVLAQKRNITVSHILIPVSFASQFGGVCTLIGTSTNLLVNSFGIESGLKPFSLFEFAPLGLVITVVGIAYLLITSKWLPKRTGEAGQMDKYRLDDYLAEFQVQKDSPLIGSTWEKAKKSNGIDSDIANFYRDGKSVSRRAKTIIREDDLLLITGNLGKLIELPAKYGLIIKKDPEVRNSRLAAENTTLIEVLLSPRSSLIGSSLSNSSFFEPYKATVLAMQRRGQVIRERLADIKLEFGDTLLLQGNKDDLMRLMNSPNVIVTNELSDLYIRKHRAVIAVLIFALVIIFAALGVFPIMISALLGAIMMVLTRCLTIDEAYQAIDWKIIFLLGGLLPLGLALEQHGGALLIANAILNFAEHYGPVLILAIFYITSAVLTETMSNNATAVILAPIAIAVGTSLNIDPRPLLVAIAFAASTSFATPIGYQTNTMILSAGGYRFTDFTVIGLPLNIIFFVIAVLLIPILWPF
ncbi:MAG: SLC13 family permease, partial [Dehalococcoidales bacterium]|nr:SLC13 family permease [Dehalococcoidales bacterium]